MQSGKIAPDRRRPPAEPEPADLFDIANRFPATTGLPMTIWVSPLGNARHGVRIKVNTTYRNRMTAAAVIGARPAQHVISGRLSAGDQRTVFERVHLNAAALVAYSEGQIDTVRLGQRLRSLARGAQC